MQLWESETSESNERRSAMRELMLRSQPKPNAARNFEPSSSRNWLPNGVHTVAVPPWHESDMGFRRLPQNWKAISTLDVLCSVVAVSATVIRFGFAVTANTSGVK